MVIAQTLKSERRRRQSYRSNMKRILPAVAGFESIGKES